MDSDGDGDPSDTTVLRSSIRGALHALGDEPLDLQLGARTSRKDSYRRITPKTHYGIRRHRVRAADHKLYTSFLSEVDLGESLLAHSAHSGNTPLRLYAPANQSPGHILSVPTPEDTEDEDDDDTWEEITHETLHAEPPALPDTARPSSVPSSPPRVPQEPEEAGGAEETPAVGRAEGGAAGGAWLPHASSRLIGAPALVPVQRSSLDQFSFQYPSAFDQGDSEDVLIYQSFARMQEPERSVMAPSHESLEMYKRFAHFR